MHFWLTCRIPAADLRYIRGLRGRRRISPARTARPAQSSRGLGLARRSNLVPQHEQLDVFGRGRPAKQHQPAASRTKIR